MLIDFVMSHVKIFCSFVILLFEHVVSVHARIANACCICLCVLILRVTWENIIFLKEYDDTDVQYVLVVLFMELAAWAIEKESTSAGSRRPSKPKTC